MTKKGYTIKRAGRRKRELTKKEIRKIVPYREPFLFIDKITKLTKKEIVAEKKVTKGYDFFKGHFVGFPIMPGTLTLEAIGQATTLLVRRNIRNHHKKDILLYKIKSADFLRPIFPDTRIKLKSSIVKKDGDKFHCRGEAVIRGKAVCKTEVIVIAVDKKKFREESNIQAK